MSYGDAYENKRLVSLRRFDANAIRRVLDAKHVPVLSSAQVTRSSCGCFYI